MSDLAALSAGLFAELVRDQDRGLARLNAAYEVALGRVTARALDGLDPDGELARLQPSPQALAALQRGAGDLAQALAILSDLQAELAAEFEREDEWARRYFLTGAEALEVDTLALQELLSHAHTQAVTGLGAYHVRQVHQAVLSHVLGRARPSRLRARLAKLTSISKAQADRVLTDALMTYSRGVHDAKARAHGYKHFLYSGPRDGLNRRFCGARIGKVYTRGQIARMDNGQTADVMHTCGGYRCRHHWRAVKRAWFTPEDWARMRETT